MPHDVFISYSNKDKSVSEALCANLEAAGIRCWIAPRDMPPGDDWLAAVPRAISQSRLMVLVFSASSNSSDYVSRELFLAANNKLVVIPFMIENIQPEPGKQYYLARAHWLDATNPPTQAQINALTLRVLELLPLQKPLLEGESLLEEKNPLADMEQLERLKKDLPGWNKRRQANPGAKIYLAGADLTGADLNGADLHAANLLGANLNGVDLSGDDLHGADLSRANLKRANLSSANLNRAKFTGAKLYRADFSDALLNDANLMGADLKYADLRDAHLKRANLCWADLSASSFRGADLRGAILCEAKLHKADFTESNLTGADFTNAKFGATVLGGIDLSETTGLDKVKHKYPSQVSTGTLERSKGKISEAFLRGCGLSDWEIESAKLYQPSLSAQAGDAILYRMHDLRFGQALQINPLFISYCHADGPFVDEMEDQLDKNGIRFWRDIHDAPAGPLEKIVDREMRLHPTVLLVLSENSTRSDWVEHETRKARALAKELGRDVLCPVALDDSWKDSAWPERLREQIMEYNILDFSQWQDPVEFAKVFKKLIAGLDLFYKPG
jgi:uncharacterized protein YjbI with pentapeptide repeats